MYALVHGNRIHTNVCMRYICVYVYMAHMCVLYLMYIYLHSIQVWGMKTSLHCESYYIRICSASAYSSSDFKYPN